MTSRSVRRAFTLIEMAIVLVIIGLLVGLVAPIVTDMIKREKSSAATAYMEQLRDEIIGFALMNKNLPKYADSTNDLGARTDPYGNKILVPDSERSGLDDADVYYYYTDGNSLCSGDKPDDLFTIKQILPGGSHGDACGTANVECYEDIAFIIASPGRNLERQFSEPDSDNVITVYDTRVPTASRDDDLEAYDDTVLYVSYNYLRGKICTNSSNDSYAPPGSDVSFAQNMGTFAGPATEGGTGTVDPHSGGTATVTVNVEEGTIEMSTEADTSGAGCVWYQGDDTTGDCASGKCDWGSGVRAYFTFRLDAEDADEPQGYGGGFTFAVVDGNNAANACGVGGQATWDSWLGYSEVQGTLGAGGGVLAPKMAVEVDTFADGSKCDPGYNHAALVYWTGDQHSNKHGEDIPSATTSDGTTTPVTAGTFTPYNPTLTATEISATDPGNTYAACQDDPSGSAQNTAGFTHDTGAGANKRNWLEDGLPHNVRVEIERDTTTTPHSYKATVWMDCSNCADLTTGWTGVAANDGNGKKITHTLSANPDNWNTIRFGWTMSSGNLSQQTISLSNFGMKFLP